MKEIKDEQESSAQSAVINSKSIRVLIRKNSDGLGAKLYHGRQFVCYLNLRDYKFGLPELIEAVRQYEGVGS
jgi:hypothetical protein